MSQALQLGSRWAGGPAVTSLGHLPHVCAQSNWSSGVKATKVMNTSSTVIVTFHLKVLRHFIGPAASSVNG